MFVYNELASFCLEKVIVKSKVLEMITIKHAYYKTRAYLK